MPDPGGAVQVRPCRAATGRLIVGDQHGARRFTLPARCRKIRIGGAGLRHQIDPLPETAWPDQLLPQLGKVDGVGEHVWTLAVRLDSAG